jgi:hypothetical protein
MAISHILLLNGSHFAWAAWWRSELQVPDGTRNCYGQRLNPVLIQKSGKRARIASPGKKTFRSGNKVPGRGESSKTPKNSREIMFGSCCVVKMQEIAVAE